MVVVHVCIAVGVVIMACQLTLADVFLGGRTGAQHLSLPVYAHLHIPDGGYGGAAAAVSLSVCPSAHTRGEKGWMVATACERWKGANVSHGHGGAPEAACVCRPCVAWTAWCACVAVVRLPTRRHVHELPGDGLMGRRRFS